MAFWGDVADGTLGIALSHLRDVDVAGTLQRGELDTHIATRGFRHSAQVHKFGIFHTVESHHDFQSQHAVQHRINKREYRHAVRIVWLLNLHFRSHFVIGLIVINSIPQR